MGEPYKVREYIQYSETAIYDADGIEVARWSNYDHMFTEADLPEPLTEDEFNDYIKEDD